MNPFISFCLYVAARVFVQFLKSRPDDSQTADSLRFLLSAMNALKRRNPLTESFLVQLDVDLEALGLRIPKLKSAFPRSNESVGFSIIHFSIQLGEADKHRQPGPRAAMPNACEPHEANRAVGIAGGFQGEVRLTTEADGNTAVVMENLEGAGHTPASQPGSGIPTRERSSGPAAHYVPGSGMMPTGISMATYTGSEMDTGSTNDMSVTSGDGGTSGTSNRGTPISNSTSEHRQTLAPGGRMNSTSGRNSFEASPVPSHQNLGGSIPVPTSQGEVPGSVDGFFGNPGTFSMSPGVTTGMAGHNPGAYSMPETPGSAGEFSMPQSWHDITGQPAMTPVGNGVLHSIMAMGPMEAMDMGGWEGSP